MAFDNDSDVYEDHAGLYHSGKRLILTPHKSPAPFGSSSYPESPNLTSKQMTPTDEEKGAFRDLDMVDGGYGSQYIPGPQKVLCKVVQTASASSDGNENKALVLGQLVFLKLYDPLFWPLKVDLSEFCFKVTVRAGFAQSNEVGAYSHLFKAGLTGFPHLAPQYHGFWAVSATCADPKYAVKVRHVVALALEYVEGRCLSDLFQPSGPFRNRFRSSWSNPQDPPTYISAYEDTRLSIMEKLMDGLMSEEFAEGTVSQYSMYLENKRLEEKRRLEESKPDESNKPDENSEENKPREETVLAEEVL
ncbi:hypothetical protein GCG54_00012362 [Colletotrichum gloeosporioides]|uniref:Protein kinase domain-containing protein n=1 Tax=Colletotrichum gloeosporioides TaxID=474922 RepID=A0A8H4FHK6_COLGL|nr:uncharacterized protein GCG54_00012362 [Colletotrichum gloeosporioides]KAF3802116.1 hypothetical protein GCG54_00012362 [Colletotrichum gloeosporioides]